jgi:two-component system, cell cycle sensor histidine kinase and response regulator CckA
MPEGGRLIISTRGERLDAGFCAQHPWARSGSYAVVDVTDSGPGIPPEILEHIFEPFFTTKEVGKGTGLGLATVYGIVKQHDGFIHVLTTPGGSTFLVYLPASQAEPTAEEPQPAAPAAGKGHETILLAEDEELVRNLTLRVLEQNGYRVLVAKDGDEAIGLVEARGAEIDLALLDVVMPKVSGPQVRARIRELQPQMAVLFCSGYSRHMLRAGALGEDEGAELLVKPYAPATLLSRVRALLASRGTAQG